MSIMMTKQRKKNINREIDTSGKNKRENIKKMNVKRNAKKFKRILRKETARGNCRLKGKKNEQKEKK